MVAPFPLTTISGSLRAFWQNEIDKYSVYHQEKVIRVAISGPAPPLRERQRVPPVPHRTEPIPVVPGEKTGSITVTSTPRKIAATLSPSKKMICFSRRKTVPNCSSPTVRMRILRKRVHLHIRLLPLGKPYFMATLG